MIPASSHSVANIPLWPCRITEELARTLVRHRLSNKGNKPSNPQDKDRATRQVTMAAKWTKQLVAVLLLLALGQTDNGNQLGVTEQYVNQLLTLGGCLPIGPPSRQDSRRRSIPDSGETITTPQ